MSPTVSAIHSNMICRTFTVTLVRHGETWWNRESRMQGQLDTELSDLGREQARLVGEALKDVTFTHMYSSDLQRAADTAKAILHANTASSCQLRLDKRLRERGFGCMEGKPHSEFLECVKQAGIPAAVYTPEGGETVEQAAERSRIFFLDLCRVMLEQDTSTSACLDTSPPGLPQATHITEDVYSNNTSSPSCNTPPPGLSDNIPKDDIDTSDIVHLDKGHALVVSHGLWLRELRNIIAERFTGDLAQFSAELKNLSTNTAKSQMTLEACRHVAGEMSVKCVSIDVLNDHSHLIDAEGRDFTKPYQYTF